MSSESTSNPECRDRPALLCRSLKLDLVQNGYHKKSDGQMKPIMTAPTTIIEMVSCCCKTLFFCRCSCITKSLSCTDLSSEAVSVRMARTQRTSMTDYDNEVDDL